MENHGDRKEIQEALKTGSGHAERTSKTLSQKTLYYALRLSDNSVLRVSSTQYLSGTSYGTGTTTYRHCCCDADSGSNYVCVYGK